MTPSSTINFYTLLLFLSFLAGAAQAETVEKGLYFSLSNPFNRQASVRFESEHRPLYKRQYWLSKEKVSPFADAYVRYPDGTIQDLDIETSGGGTSIRLNMKRGDGQHHGIHNIYLTDRRVNDGTMVIQTAKWSTIHHSCAWGHEHKYNSERLVPAPLEKTPLEISGVDLWDGNFHIQTRSGQTLSFRIFSYGKPMANVAITVTSAKGWQRRLISDNAGYVSFQMIRDYYPESWSRFKKSKNSALFLKAEVELEQKGDLDGIPYAKVRLVATFPWRYAPAHEDYASYQAGLTVGGAAFLATIGGLFFYRRGRKKPFQEWTFDEKA